MINDWLDDTSLLTRCLTSTQTKIKLITFMTALLHRNADILQLRVLSYNSFDYLAMLCAKLQNPGRDMLILFNNSFPRLIMSWERLIKSWERVIMSSERLIKSWERLIKSWERLIKSSERVIMSWERLIKSSERLIKSWERVIMSWERLIKSWERLIKSSERLIKSWERVIMSWERLIKSFERLIKSWERVIMSSERLINSSERLILCRPNDLLCCNANLRHSLQGTGCPRPHQACNYSTPVYLAISTAESLGHTSSDALATAPEPHRDWGWMHPPPKKKKKKKEKKRKKYFVVESF